MNEYINLNEIRLKDMDYLNNYWSYLILIGLFYLTPSLQFILFQSTNNVECHYNTLCAHKVGNIMAFNNVISNIFYIIFGFIYIIIIKYKPICNDGISPSGLFLNKSLYYSLGIALILEGISSSIYHVCPSKLNFQFDTTFMIIGILLAFLTLYTKRHRYSIIKPFKFYLMVFFVLTLNVLSLNTDNNAIQLWFWGAIFIFMTYIMVFGSIYVYYGKEYDLDIESFKSLVNKIKTLKHHDKPRFILLTILNIITLGSCIFAAFIKPNFTEWVLMISVFNLIAYFSHYMVLKNIKKETIYLTTSLAIFINIILFAVSIYFFVNNPTNIFETVTNSNKLNQECVLFNFFDYHDLWHFFSAVSLFLFMNIILFVDDDLHYTLEESIEIF